MNITELKCLLENLRKEDKFIAFSYVCKKINAINDYFDNNNLNSCVIGLSGGIDSAVVYYLLLEASKKINSPIKLIEPLLMPIYGNGSTGQDKSTEHALSLKNVRKKNIYDLTSAYQSYININNRDCRSWTNGQLASIVRTPFVYYKAAQLQEIGYKSVVIGTTNKSEKLLGFYGKASDYMVDIQPIHDLYKSQVYSVAEYLNVPKEIINRNPVGDVHDGSTDEELIGSPYWFVELYFRTSGLVKFIVDSSNSLTNSYIENIEKMLKHNNHKFNVGSPSVFL